MNKEAAEKFFMSRELHGFELQLYLFIAYCYGNREKYNFYGIHAYNFSVSCDVPITHKLYEDVFGN